MSNYSGITYLMTPESSSTLIVVLTKGSSAIRHSLEAMDTWINKTSGDDWTRRISTGR